MSVSKFVSPHSKNLHFEKKLKFLLEFYVFKLLATALRNGLWTIKVIFQGRKLVRQNCQLYDPSPYNREICVQNVNQLSTNYIVTNVILVLSALNKVGFSC